MELKTSGAPERRIATPISECALAQAIAAIGDAWTLLILREVLCGATRFEMMQEDLGISRAVLADRLKKTVDAGILARIAYRSPGQRRRYRYEMTAKGRALLPALLALRQWSDEHLRDTPSQVIFTDTEGSRVRVRMVNDDDREVHPDDVVPSASAAMTSTPNPLSGGRAHSPHRDR